MKEKKRKGRTRINLTIIASSPPISPDARITNLSATGAFITSLQTLPADSQVAIDFQLPGHSETMSLNARVIWTEPASFAAPGGMGIEFTNLLPKHQEKLAAFIEQNSRPESS